MTDCNIQIKEQINKKKDFAKCIFPTFFLWIMAVKFSNMNTSHTLLSNICWLERDHSDLRGAYISYICNKIYSIKIFHDLACSWLKWRSSSGDFLMAPSMLIKLHNILFPWPPKHCVAFFATCVCRGSSCGSRWSALVASLLCASWKQTENGTSE